MTKTEKAAAWLIEQFAMHGIVVQRYDAITTNSVYLKLDYGVLGSLRIGDHRGKKKYTYKYNLEQGVQRHIVQDRGIDRVYCPFRDIDMLVDKILYDRKRLVMRYGEESYVYFMEKNQHDNADRKGFWQSAELVQETFTL